MLWPPKLSAGPHAHEESLNTLCKAGFWKPSISSLNPQIKDRLKLILSGKKRDNKVTRFKLFQKCNLLIPLQNSGWHICPPGDIFLCQLHKHQRESKSMNPPSKEMPGLIHLPTQSTTPYTIILSLHLNVTHSSRLSPPYSHLRTALCFPSPSPVYALCLLGNEHPVASTSLIFLPPHICKCWAWG